MSLRWARLLSGVVIGVGVLLCELGDLGLDSPAYVQGASLRPRYQPRRAPDNGVRDVADPNAADPDPLAATNQIEALRAFVADAVARGELHGLGQGRTAARRLVVFDNQLRGAVKLAGREDLVRAQRKLSRLLLYVDGSAAPVDLLVGEALGATHGRLEALVAVLEAVINPPPIELSLTVTVEGRGSVVVEPDQAVYSVGEVVEVRAEAGTNYCFSGWSGALESSEKVVTFTMSEDTEVTATFVEVQVETVLDVWYGDHQVFGDPGVAQPWVNILGNVLAPEEVVSLTYSLNGGMERELSIGPRSNIRLVGEGDFNVELAYADLPYRLNDLELKAYLANGTKVQKDVTLEYARGHHWPLPYELNWREVEDLQRVVQVVDGQWVFDADGLYPTQYGYDRNVILGDLAWENYEITVPVYVVELHYTTPYFTWYPAVGVIVHWNGHVERDPNESPRTGWYPMGAMGWFRWGSSPGSGSYQMYGSVGNLVGEGPEELVMVPGVEYIWKMRAENQPGALTHTVYRFKSWRAEEEEPEVWLFSYENTWKDYHSGSIMLFAHKADVVFGDITVEALAGPVFDSFGP